jgi:integrase
MITFIAIDKAKPQEKPYKLLDGGGLHLLIQPGGSKLWRFRYRFAGKENMLTFGRFPEVSLASARDKRHEARKLLAEGIDPAQKRKADKLKAEFAARNTFRAVAEDYISNLEDQGKAQTTIDKRRWLLLDLAKPLAKRPIADVTAYEVLDLLKKIQNSGRRETAQRLRGTIGAVFRLAIATLRATNDPTYPLRGALLQPKVQHRAAITDERELGALMTCIDEYDGWPTLRAAMLFLALTMTRPGDVRHMKRSEVVFPRALWRIPAERMKMRRPHDVPLSRQALAVLREIWEYAPGELVFPALRSSLKPLSENAMNAALRRMGYTKEQVTSHGFRSSASTILNERGFNSDWIEAALAHQDEDEVRRAYNRATYLAERVKLMQTWADLLDEFRSQAAARTVA